MQEKRDGSLTCSLIEDFETIEATYEASRNRLLAYFEQVAELGPKALNSDQCHLVDPANKIYEFIAGRLRVLFFNGRPGSVVVCTHMFLKKTQKTPPQEIKKAVRAKAQYESAERIEWKDEI